MTQTLIPAGASRMLLVEGLDDIEFFTRLISYLNSQESSRLPSVDCVISHYRGKDNLANYLYQMGRDTSFHQLTHLGIVRDADFDTDAFESICSALRSANRQIGSDLFSIPSSVLQLSREKPRVLALTIPLDDDGALERLLVAALRADSLFQCVDKYFSCVDAMRASDLADNRMDKNRLRVFIAGKEVDKNQATGDDRKRNLLRNLYSMSWLPPDFWTNEAFDAAKVFLRQLLTN